MPIKRDDVTVRYGADDSAFMKVTNRVRATVKGLGGDFGKVGNALSKIFSRTGAGIFSALTTGFAAAAKSALGFADSLAKTSDKVGLSIEALQELRYAASASGVDQRTLDMAMQRFSRRVGEAANGTGVLNKELVALGIPLRDIQGNMRSNEDILGDYANAVMNARSSQEQLRLSFVAFDSEGAALVNMLRQGKIGMDEARESARELGLVIDENTVRASEKLNQAMDDFTSKYWAKFQHAVLSLAHQLDLASGSYRTLDDMQRELLVRINELATAEDLLARTFDFAQGPINRRIRGLREQIAVLDQAIEREKRLQKTQEDARNNPPPESPETTTTTTTSKAKKNRLTYHQQNLKDYQEYRSGKIDRAEWLKRENERNPFRNPDSPYREEFGMKDPSAKPDGFNSAIAPLLPRDTIDVELLKKVDFIASGIVDKIGDKMAVAVEKAGEDLDETVGKERDAPIRLIIENAEATTFGPDGLSDAATSGGLRSGHENQGGSW